MTTMNSFPLYTHLSKDIEALRLPPVSQKSRKDLYAKITGLNKEGDELIYALVWAYAQDKQNYKENELPYNGTRSVENIQWDLTLFPDGLFHLLERFVDLHRQRMQEDQDKKVI